MNSVSAPPLIPTQVSSSCPNPFANNAAAELHRWLCPAVQRLRFYLVIFGDVLGMQDIKWRRKVLVGQMRKLDRN